MKKLLVCALLLVASAAKADPADLICLAGGIDATGQLKSMSQNPAQVLVLKGGDISIYSLKSPFDLLKSKYNLKNPFDMSFVNKMGTSGKYSATGTGMTAKFNVIETANEKSTVDFSADTNTLKGKVTVDSFKGGQWAGTTQDNLNCTKAGTK